MAHTICFLCTFLLYVCHFQYFCSGTDTIRYGHWIDEGGAEEIVSAGNIFRLGFFTRGNASRRYVGIWYCDSPEVIVWVANREVPIPTNASGTFGIHVKGGNLEVSDRGHTSTYFSTKLPNVTNSQTYLRRATLLDNGNLVLFSSGRTEKKLWESFKQPTDTFLPGMKMDGYLTLTSWRSEEDPAPGDFSFQLDEDIRGGYFIKKSGLEPYWKSGGESANNSFIQKQMSFAADLLLSGTIDSNTSKVVNHSRLWMRPDGKIQYLSWEFDKKEWSLGWSEPEGPCNFYSVCGSYGSCKPDSRTQKIPVCTCLPGFKPNNEDDWKLGKFSGGCSKMPSKCTHDNTTSFFKMRVNTLQSNTPRFIPDGKENNCTLKCQNDCGCRAYAYKNKNTNYNKKLGSSESGCWLWLDEINAIQEGSAVGDHILFFRVDPPSPSHIDLGLSPTLPVANANLLRNRNPSTLREVIISTTTVIFAVALLCSIAYISYRRVVAKRKDRNFKDNQALQFYDNEDLMDQDNQFGEDDKKDIDVPFFEFESIVAATDNFSKAYKLGQGGFGPVYKGKFPGGEEIAVKRLSSNSGQGLKEFKNEVVLIAKLQHRNLVRLLGYCIKRNEKILLYEYMPNKSLDAFIFDEKISMLLNWATRFEIIIGVARGLLYLHQDSRLRIIHRDMKASNILLDEEMNPKISDFGLAKIVGRRETESNTTRVMGTYGYMAPEYALEGQFSVKSDTFSFGVVVLEIISGKKNTGFFDSQLALSLLGYAWSLWKEEKPMTLLDEMLVGSCNDSEVLKCITVGLLCVQEDPSDRPDMSKVVYMLSSETETLPNPKQPAFVTRKRFYGTTSSSSTKPETQSKNEITFSEEDGR